ncbi:hypothetical protein R76727_03259 [Ralstonia mannitolilytica]|nr:hypothetical protein R76727_03259 [Ralstonia mannitolilytica]
MSTEHQQYSTQNQADKIREYAQRRGIQIVRTYADEGKSGLRLDGRQALQQLIKDVESGTADFQVILVYDVSRWGRLEFVDAPCLVANDDEGYTYNNRLNRVSTIQVHFMIRRALERGVPREKLAKALNVDVRHIIMHAALLNGVCPEAAELLKDFHFSPNLGAVLRKLKPTRQIECVELMIAANNITVSYAQALVAATPSNLLLHESKPRKLGGVTAEQMAKMEREMGNLQGQLKLVEQSYGQDVLNLVLAKGYLTKLVSNEAVFRFLSQKHPDVLREFETLTRSVSLEA